jgi:hypothetical protein
MIFTIAIGVFLGLWLFLIDWDEIIEFILDRWLLFAVIGFIIYILAT